MTKCTYYFYFPSAERWRFFLVICCPSSTVLGTSLCFFLPLAITTILHSTNIAVVSTHLSICVQQSSAKRVWVFIQTTTIPADFTIELLLLIKREPQSEIRWCSAWLRKCFTKLCKCFVSTVGNLETTWLVCHWLSNVINPYSLSIIIAHPHYNFQRAPLISSAKDIPPGKCTFMFVSSDCQ